MKVNYENSNMRSYSKNKIISSIIINMALPLILYKLLLQLTTNNMAIFIVALIPVVSNIFTIIKTHKINKYGSITFLMLVIGFFLSMITGDERWMLVKGSFLTGILGVILILSSIMYRPLMAYLLQLAYRRRFGVEKSFEVTSKVKNKLNMINCILGILLLIDTMAHIYLAFNLTTTEFLTVTPFIKIATIAIFVLNILWLKRTMIQRDNM